MKKKVYILLLIFIAMIFCNFPVYANGYENISLLNIIIKLILYLFAFVLVIILAMLVTRFIGKNLKGLSSSKYITILDTMNLPGSSKLVIAKINKNIYILSTNNSNTNVIDIINKEDFDVDGVNFENYLSKYLNKSNQDNILEILLNKYHKKKDKEDNKNEEEN